MQDYAAQPTPERGQRSPVFFTAEGSLVHGLPGMFDPDDTLLQQISLPDVHSFGESMPWDEGIQLNPPLQNPDFPQEIEPETENRLSLPGSEAIDTLLNDDSLRRFTSTIPGK